MGRIDHTNAKILKTDKNVKKYQDSNEREKLTLTRQLEQTS